jgi:hypothetical protein
MLAATFSFPHPPDHLAVLNVIRLLLVEREGLLSFVPGLLLVFLLPMDFGEMNHLSKDLIFLEEGSIVLAA